jgi:hypothetical protein
MDKNSREYLQRNFSQGRMSLMVILALTAVNIAMVMLESDRYFVCSISIPYMLCYLGQMEAVIDGFEFQLPTCMAVSVVILGVFLAIWLLSKKRPGLLYAALILFFVDTAALFWLCVESDTLGESVVDLLFHAWVLWELFQGARCGTKLDQQIETAPVPVVNAPTTGADFLKGAAAEETDKLS